MNVKQQLMIRGLSAEDVWDYENGFYWFSSSTRLNKMLAHYELYKSIRGLPGEIFELGVYKGASLIRLATFRNALENDYSRKVVGFDSFGDFPTDKLSLESDSQFIERFEEVGGPGLGDKELNSILSSKGFENVQLVKGNVFDTLPAYLLEHSATRIALLHLDMDVKEPTEFALETLFDRVVPNGLIVIDDYSTVAGATNAVDSFLRRHDLEIEKLDFYKIPSFIRKPR